MLGKSERGCGTAEKGAYWGSTLEGREELGARLTYWGLGREVVGCSKGVSER